MRYGMRMAVVLVVMVLLVPSVHAQQFGKNKVTYNPADWQEVRDEHGHFILYLPKDGFGGPDGLYRWGGLLRQMAERGYQKNKRLWGVDLQEPARLLIYPNRSAFEQTHIYPGFLPEGVGAFADPTGRSISIPLDSRPEEIERILVHEIVHIFEYQFFWRNAVSRILRANAPGAIMEGAANYVAGIHPRDRMLVAALTIDDAIPSLTQIMYGSGYLVEYVLGTVVFEFLEEEYGMATVRTFLETLQHSSRWDPLRAIRRATGQKTTAQASEAFRQYLRAQYLPRVLDDQEIEDIADPLVFTGAPEAYVVDRSDESPLLFSPTASPDERFLVGFAIHRVQQAVVPLLFTADGQFLRELGPVRTLRWEYPIVQGLTVATVAGGDISFSPDGSRVAFLVRTEPNRTLMVVDTATGSVVYERRLEGFAASPLSPTFSPDGSFIAFSATQYLQRDVWLWSLDTNALINVTNDVSWDYAPVWWNDKTLLYFSNVKGYIKLFSRTLGEDDRTQLTFGQTNETTVAVSPTEGIVVASDRGDALNIYSVDPTSETMRQLTDVAVGVKDPFFLRMDGKDRLLVASARFSGGRVYHLRRVESVPDARQSVRDFAPAIPRLTELSPILYPQEMQEARRSWDFSMGPIFGGFSTAYGNHVLASTSFAFIEEPFRERFIGVTLQSQGEFRYFAGTYANRRGRLNWGVRAVQFRLQGLTIDREKQRFRRKVVYGSDTVSIVGEYPWSKWTRLEAELGFENRLYNLPPQFGSFLSQHFRSGKYGAVRMSLVNDTARYRWFGPYDGRQLRVDLHQTLPLGGLSFRELRAEYRWYRPLTQSSLLALRLRAFGSFGEDPSAEFFGGWDQLRGYRPYSLSGNRWVFGNVEYRFPIAYDSSVGPLRGTLFFDVATSTFSAEFDFRELFATRGIDYSYGGGITLYSFGPPISIYYVRPSEGDHQIDFLVGLWW